MDNIQLKIGSKFKGNHVLSYSLSYFFKGIKHIPVGAHYLYYSLAEEKHMFKVGFFIYAKPGDVRKFIEKFLLNFFKVYVRKWDEELQDFIDIDNTDEGGSKNNLNENKKITFL